MDEALKQSILRNPFIIRLRELRVDEDAFQELAEALRRLAAEWKGQPVIDKELASELYVVIQVMRNMLQTLRAHGSPDADRVEEMWIDLDNLVLECLVD
jgi:hypothetical protein